MTDSMLAKLKMAWAAADPCPDFAWPDLTPEQLRVLSVAADALLSEHGLTIDELDGCDQEDFFRMVYSRAEGGDDAVRRAVGPALDILSEANRWYARPAKLQESIFRMLVGTWDFQGPVGLN